MRWLIVFTAAAIAFGQPGSAPRTVPLWPGAAPRALGDQDADRPTLTIFVPRAANGTGVIVCPGGGYRALADNHEGRQVANFLNGLGITAFVLRYRLGPRYHHPVELGDAQRAIRMVRSQAKEFGLATDRIGIIGFSAGGHLASSAATHFDAGNPSAADPIGRASSRPDFLILGYPVISLLKPYAHQGSVTNLLGENPDPKLAESMSSELQVSARTPPTFLFHTNEDKVVPAENSVLFYLALRKNNVPAEIHIFEKGPHGAGLGFRDPALGMWPALLTNWLRGRGLL